MTTESKLIVDRIVDVLVNEVADRLFNNPEFVAKLVSSEAFMKVAVFPTVKPENITGLDEYVEDKVQDALEGVHVDAENVNNLDEAIESAMNDREITADEISGLEESIEGAISGVEVEADNVTGLAEAIEDAIVSSKSITNALKKSVLNGLTVTVDAKIDGQSIENVLVNNAYLRS